MGSGHGSSNGYSISDSNSKNDNAAGSCRPTPVIEVSDLSVTYHDKGAGIFARKAELEVIRNLTLELHEGEILGLVGESGCGKSTLARTIVGLERNFTGQVIHKTSRPQMVFQDPYTSLNPSMTVRRIVEEPLILAKIRDRNTRRDKVIETLSLVGLGPEYLNRLPRELSGGQRQRVNIAAALIAEPKVLIADEPVSALDATIQVQILDLLWELHQKLNLSILLISHDLAVVENLCKRVLIMQNGRIIESGPVKTIFENPEQPYTRVLIEASRIRTQ